MIYGFAIVRDDGQFATAHLYTKASSRDNGLKHFRREYKKTWDVVFLVFEIPLGIYIDNAQKVV